MIKKLLVITLSFGLTGCSLFHNPLAPSDVVSYQVIGVNISGNVIIHYNTPTNADVVLTTPLTAPFLSGAIAGYSQFIKTKPAVTVTIINTGCVTLQILIDSSVKESANGCGPGTFSVSH